ncbi:MAG: Holliday junction resolvase RuvX [Rhodospirillales bacterium]|nr:Holliday junction resolvase RuvX [Rhodospirillales bacterium]
MAICDLRAMGGLLGPEARLMGLDLGAKTMGVAVSDVSRTIATARTTIRRTKLSRDIETLRAMIAADGIGGIVVGLPVNMDGSEGPRAQSARDTAARLAEALALPVALWDERLSTVAAERPLLDADLSRRKRARVVDQVAAAFILQGALDRLRAG